MQRVTISVDDSLVDEIDRYLRIRGYQTRSEGFRDLVREALERWRAETADSAHCVAVVSYVFQPEPRALGQNLSHLLQANHDLIISQTQTPLDHENSLSSLMLKGPTPRVRALAQTICAERGVRFGAVNVVAVEAHDDHAHPVDHVHGGKAHLSPHRG